MVEQGHLVNRSGRGAEGHAWVDIHASADIPKAERVRAAPDMTSHSSELAGAQQPEAHAELVPVGQCVVGTALWRLNGALNVTVIVKATFAFMNDLAMTQVEPQPIIPTSVYFDEDPKRGVRIASDLAPSLSRADIVLTGHACAPVGAPVPSLSVRLVVFRDAPLVDKAILVRGDVGPNGETLPFERIPLVYERAYGGVGWSDNPLGRGVHEGTGQPNLVDPRKAHGTACFAPIPRAFPVRKRLLGQTDRRMLDRTIAEIPDGFDWMYFQSAPVDQRTDYLHGTEWIILERMTADPTFVRSQLPGARGFVKIAGLSSVSEEHALPLAADTLRIDADNQRCTVVWRRHFPVGSIEEVTRLCVQGAVQVGGAPIEWPGFRPPRVMMTAEMPLDGAPPPPMPPPNVTSAKASPSTPPAAAAPPRDARGNFVGTMLIEPAQAERAPTAPAVPFKPGPANPPAQKSRPPDGDDRPFGGTVSLDGPAARAANAPKSTPFVRPATTAPPGVAVVSPPPLVGSALEAKGPPAAPTFSPRPAAPFIPDDATSDDAPLAQRFDRSSQPPAAPPAITSPAAPPVIVPVGTPVFGEVAAQTFGQQATQTAARAHGHGPAAPPGRPTAASGSTGAGVTVVNATPLAFEAFPWGLTPSRDCLAVIAKLTADIVPGGPAKVRASPDPISGERWAEAPTGGRTLAYPTDRALFKARADVVAIASAHPPKGPTTRLEVRFAFGSAGNAFERNITVHGDRRWSVSGNVSAASPPEPFLRMALGWERAFGGKGHDANPVGVGMPDRLRKSPAPLPNLEDPARRMRTPKQAPPPVAIAPMPLAWSASPPDRARGGRWPLFPEDLDWTRFQCAPVEQRLAYLRGDEPFAFDGMHRAHPALEGSLPGVRARAFAASGERFDEIPLHLDTVVFTLEELRVDLVFRGALPVADERNPAAVSLHVVTEPVTAPPMTLDEARAKLRRP